jgi:hypothetical protein
MKSKEVMQTPSDAATRVPGANPSPIQTRWQCDASLLLGGLLVEIRFPFVAAWRMLHPGVELLRLWHGMTSLISYLLHVTLLARTALHGPERVGRQRSP